MEEWIFSDSLFEEEAEDEFPEEEDELEAFNEAFSAVLFLDGKVWESEESFYCGTDRYRVFGCEKDRGKKIFKVWGDLDEHMEEIKDECELSRLYGARDAFFGV